MKIRHKLILSFLLVALLASVTTLFALHSYASIDGTFTHLVDDPTSMVATLNDLKHSGLHIVSSTNEYALIKDEGGWNAGKGLEEEEEELNQRGIESFRDALQRYETLVKTVATDEETTLQNITAAGNNLIETSGEIIELKKQNVLGNEILDRRITFERDEEAYLKYVDEALRRESDEEAKGQEEVRSTIQWATRGTVIVTILTFMLALFAGFYISHLIAARVTRLQNAVQLVGIGEFEGRIEIGAKDEIGELARSFNGMVGDLKAAGETLRDSEARHRLLFESNPFPMWVYDKETYAFLAVNDAATNHYGYSREEFLAMTLKDIRPAEDVPVLLGYIANGDSHNHATSIWKHRKKNGTAFDVEVTAYGLEFDGRPAELVLANDITDRKRLEAESRIISEIIHGLATTHNLEELLALVHKTIGEMLYAENCYIALYDPKTQFLNIPFCVDKFDAVASPAKLGRGLTSYVFRNSRPLLLTPKLIGELVEEGEVEVVGTLPAIWLGVPLRTPNGTTGVLVVQHYEDPTAYTQRDLEFLSAVGDQIAMAIERQRANDALAESEESYRELIENAHDIIYTHDLEGNYTSINKAAEFITGYTRDEALAMNLAETIVPEYIDQARRMIAKKINGEETTAYDLDVIAKNGQRVSLEVNTRIVREDGIPVAVQGIARDVTARKRAADELAESQANFKSLFDTANDAILVMDGSTFLDCNHQTEILFGCAKENIVGHSPIEFSPPVQPDGRPTPEKAGEYMAAAMTGSPQFFEWKHTRLDGTPFDAEVSLNRVDFQGAMHIQAIVRDITARKNAEEEIHWKTALLEAQVSSTIDGILIIDSSGKKILQNQQTTDLLKIPQHIADDEDDGPQVKWVTGMMKDPDGFIERVLYLNSHPDEVSREEIELTDGTILDRYSAPVVGKDTKNYGRIWTFRDVTESKRAEREVVRKTGELRVLFDLMPAKIWFKDTKNGIVRVNKKVADSLGLTVDEIEGKPAAEIYPDIHEKFYSDDLEVIGSRKARLGIVQTLVDKNGDERWKEIDKVPYHDEAGNVMGLVIVERDITDSKRLELDLRHKETLIRIAGQVTRTGGWTIDLPGNKVSWSDEVFDILEYPRGPAPPLGNALELYPEEWRSCITAAITECSANGTPFDLEVEVVTGKAERIWVRVCGEAEFNVDGSVGRLQGAFQDITSRKLADETLRLNEAKFRDLFDNAPVPYHELDTEGRFTRINHTEELLLGYTSDELKGRHPWEIIVEKVSRDVTKKKLKGTEQLKAVERTFIRKDGSHVSVLNEDRMIYDSEGNIAGIRSTLQDITELKRTERELIKSQEYLSLAHEVAKIGSFDFDLITGLSTASPALLSLYGEEDHVGEKRYVDWTKHIYPEDLPKTDENFKVALATGELDSEYRIIRKNGDIRWLWGKGRVIFDENGIPAQLVGVNMDITERKQAEEALHHFNEKLQQSNRELQDFAYVASHDLQEPLRKVQAFSDRLKTKYGDKLEGEGLDFLERMRNAAQRMQLLIQDLLTFSRVATKASPFVSVDLEKVAHEVMSDLEVKIEDTGATVEIGSLPTLDADATQMRQLIQNLVGNALKFQRKDCKPKVEISASAAASANGHGQMCTIKVTDNGIGFDEKYLDKIFAVFQRLHGRTEYEGSGVGLSVCRKIVERHHGSITASSAPGEGATFIINLPLKQRNTEVTDNEN